mmetsp:Transcript_46083/g.46760  ORF Transcript_46083/g.46760 Transcript_46083/m.46760 type:complete len:87 (-) Transcript_46083:160-420(-)
MSFYRAGTVHRLPPIQVRPTWDLRATNVTTTSWSLQHYRTILGHRIHLADRKVSMLWMPVSGRGESLGNGGRVRREKTPGGLSSDR